MMDKLVYWKDWKDNKTSIEFHLYRVQGIVFLQSTFLGF